MEISLKKYTLFKHGIFSTQPPGIFSTQPPERKYFFSVKRANDIMHI